MELIDLTPESFSKWSQFFSNLRLPFQHIVFKKWYWWILFFIISCLALWLYSFWNSKVFIVSLLVTPHKDKMEKSVVNLDKITSVLKSNIEDDVFFITGKYNDIEILSPPKVSQNGNVIKIQVDNIFKKETSALLRPPSISLNDSVRLTQIGFYIDSIINLSKIILPDSFYIITHKNIADSDVNISNIVIKSLTSCSIAMLMVIFFTTISGSLYDTKQFDDFGIKILGLVPFQKKIINHWIEKGSQTSLAESMRHIEVTINYLTNNYNDKNNVIAITSGLASEGKTTFTMLLGSILALRGKKVLLIESDLRKPKFLQRLTGFSRQELGLTNYLVGDVGKENIIFQTSFNNNLFYISSGPIPPNPFELLYQDRFSELIMNVKNDFDVILIDTPPILVVADSFFVMKKCDKVLLVTKLGLATSDMLNSIKSALDANGIDAFGLIINQVKSKEFKKLRRLGYGYGYGYYYDNNSKNAKT